MIRLSTRFWISCFVFSYFGFGRPTLYETPVLTPVARCPITCELAPAAFRVRRILPDSLTAIKPFPDINCRNSL
jgi:hypothetical protein